jgi:hypothetical protein
MRRREFITFLDSFGWHGGNVVARCARTTAFGERTNSVMPRWISPASRMLSAVTLAQAVMPPLG